MDSEKLWKWFWNLGAAGFGLLAIRAGLNPPDPAFFAIWTFSGIAARVLAEYGYDWFDL